MVIGGISSLHKTVELLCSRWENVTQPLLRCAVNGLNSNLLAVCYIKVPPSLSDTWAHAESSIVTQSPDFGVTNPILHHFFSPVEFTLCHPHHSPKSLTMKKPPSSDPQFHTNTTTRYRLSAPQYMQEKKVLPQKVLWNKCEIKTCHIY